MSIQPTSSGRSSQAGRLDGRPAVERSTRGPAADSAGGTSASDRIELSETARELAGIAGSTEIPAAELGPERLREVAARMVDGFYDRPEVIELVLSRLARAL